MEVKDTSKTNSFWKLGVHGVKNLFNFSGRVRRKEYWATILLLIIPLVLCYLLLMLSVPLKELMRNPESIALRGEVLVFNVLVFVIFAALQVRRLHDLGASGALFFISPLASILVVSAIWTQEPVLWFVGQLLNFVYGCWLAFVPGQKRANEYGEDPKTGLH